MPVPNIYHSTSASDVLTADYHTICPHCTNYAVYIASDVLTADYHTICPHCTNYAVYINVNINRECI